MKKLVPYMTCLITALAIESTPPRAGTPAPMKTVERVDLARYAGRWYEISRQPNRFQKNCSGNVTADYEVRADGRIDVVNGCTRSDGRKQSARGVARIVDETTRAKLEVQLGAMSPKLSWAM